MVLCFYTRQLIIVSQILIPPPHVFVYKLASVTTSCQLSIIFKSIYLFMSDLKKKINAFAFNSRNHSMHMNLWKDWHGKSLGKNPKIAMKILIPGLCIQHLKMLLKIQRRKISRQRGILRSWSSLVKMKKRSTGKEWLTYKEKIRLRLR